MRYSYKCPTCGRHVDTCAPATVTCNHHGTPREAARPTRMIETEKEGT